MVGNRMQWTKAAACSLYMPCTPLQGAAAPQKIEKDQNKNQLFNLSVHSEVSPVSPGNGISCSSGKGLQFLSIFGECGSLPVLDRSSCA